MNKILKTIVFLFAAFIIITISAASGEQAGAVLFFFIATILGILYFKQKSNYTKAFEKYKGIEDIESEIDKAKKEFQKTKESQENVNKKLAAQNKELTEEYTKKKLVYDKLSDEVNSLEENLEIISYGLYKPHFDFITSEEYKERIIVNRNLQRQMLKDKTAAVCKITWKVEGSEKKGEQMVIRNIKLMLRAFNGETDAAILKVRWNNVQKIEETIKKAYETINKMGETTQIQIEEKYLNLKLEELYLAYEYQEKLYQEREEQKQIREQMREEERSQKELEKAQKDAELEELRKENALIKARRELEAATGEELNRLNEMVVKLERQLEEAREKKERALSMAQQTKIGYVYVISNIGSFGEDVYKIGMTRRLEPMDRVRELGDASVPFEFDVHAIIYSKNAPELENKLHKIFDDKRVNLVNYRKEFFKVSLEEIADAVKEIHGEFDFTLIAEAKQYRETLTIREPGIPVVAIDDVMERRFPDSI
ncbi:DUF4041 domain-containing protein [Methanomethylovorans sp.]|uniref:DUF4041 domain-containing protein n=1 Tax=Methanomethylovorans sp. TaxID=2758717 RepID=UPI001BD26CF5|nr:DUF4041 domain-containing protein [Methanomethylovorans sp.]